MGPNLLLKVMSGDTVSVAVQSYYNTNSITTTNSSFTDVLNSLANGLVNSTNGAHCTLANLTASNSSVYNGLTGFLTADDPAPPAGFPKAYLNWIFLDDQFNYVSNSSGAVRAASTTYPAATLNTVAPGASINITKNGYLYIWVSNETQGWDVFFDNLSVQYKQGPLLEENHYYPFGLSMQGISDKALKTSYIQNKYRYNGKELQNQEFSDGTGLEEFDYGARMLDPQLGVWHSIDPLAEKSRRWSTYSYGYDNPSRFIDPDGMFSFGVAGCSYNDEGPHNFQDEIDQKRKQIDEDSKHLGGTADAIKDEIDDKIQEYLDKNQGKINHKSESESRANAASDGGWPDPVNAQKISELDPRLQEAVTNFIEIAHYFYGVDLRITTGYRSVEQQNKYYAQGRTTPGPVITYAKGGQNYHQYGLAFDVVIMENGRPNWNKKVSPDIVYIAKLCGFEWGGDWGKKADPPHFQMTFGQTWQQLEKRK